MAKEKERKFLVDPAKWSALEKGPGISIRQGYLFHDDKKSVRVRINGTDAYLTIKSSQPGIIRDEFEYEIPIQDAHYLLENMAGQLITKTRFMVPDGQLTWEVDVFEGENKGLVLAELEYPIHEISVSLPHWIGTEVTHDEKYYNARLSQNPYSKWLVNNT